MRPKADPASLSTQQSFIDEPGVELVEFINLHHPLVKLAEQIDWRRFEVYWSSQFGTAGGPRALPSRLVAGLFMLKSLEGLSDERLIEAWICNPYYQYFCGERFFQHGAPIDPATLVKWRKRLGESGMGCIHDMVLAGSIDSGALKRVNLSHVCVDSTVMEKSIAYPTDSELLVKVLTKLVVLMRCHGLSVRQSYCRVAPRLGQQIGRYAHARQYKRMRKGLKRLSTLTARVARELERQLGLLPEAVQQEAEVLLRQAQQLRHQALNPKCKHKVYSLHEPQVDCISKGKARVRYEFGTKVGISCTQQEGFVLAMRSLPGNPYDGHTLDELLARTQQVTDRAIKTVVVDLGYRSRHRTSAKVIHRGKKLSKAEKKRLRRRSMLEAMIGHMKNDGALDRCYLKGTEGDMIHAMLCGVGHNLRLLYNFLVKQLSRLFFACFIDRIGKRLRFNLYRPDLLAA